MFGWKLGFMSRAGLLGTGLLFWTLALYFWQEETNTVPWFAFILGALLFLMQVCSM